MKRNRLLFLLALLMTAATGAWAESGPCGPNLHWTLEGGKMTISGTGNMTSWANANKVPWNNYKSQIRSVVIGDGVTSIGEYAFEECVTIASVSFGKDVKTIGMNAFYKCLSLSEVTIPASVEKIERDAFVNCMSLNKVTVLRPATDEVTKIIGSPFSNTIMATISVYNGLIYVPAGSGETYKAKWPVIYSDKILELIPTYSVKMADGTKDAANWTISDGTTTKTGDEGLDAVAEGQSVTLKYNGRLKVKSVTATTDAAPAANPNAYMKWDNTKKELVEAEIPATATTVANADASVNWSAGTYVVEGDITINGMITLSGDVDLIIKDGAKLTANNMIYGSSNKYNLRIYGQAQMTGELVVNCSNSDAIYAITTLEVHSCQVKATASSNSRSGFKDIVTFNVYGGSFDGENTGTQGYGIRLADGGSMNIYGGEVKAVGKGSFSGIYGSMTTLTVYGGKLWAECAENQALYSQITLTKGAGFTGKIQTSDNGESWDDWESSDTPETKYVRVDY